jgi:hypothetical protein
MPATDTYATIGDVSIAFAPPAVAQLTDESLMQAQRTLAEIGRRVGASAALVAAEIAHRSRRDLGHDGLAQRLGARTPEILVQRLTETSAGEARSLVRVGRLLETEVPDAAAAPDPARVSAVDEAPWLSEVAAAVVAGHLSIERADVIRACLGTVDSGSPSPTTSAAGTPAADTPAADSSAGLSPADAARLREGLAAAAGVLLRESPGLTVERLAERARALRADLDDAFVRDRERLLRSRRYLHLFRQSDGMTRLTALLDPESAALVTSAFDAATSPRRGGPRFVDPAEQARADELASDERTVEQIAHDAFVELIRIGGHADGAKVLGSRRPAVRVLVAERDLSARGGRGFIEGRSEPVSIETVERHVCESGILPIVFDHRGQPLRMGRKTRLFTEAQRIALAARDGGCRFPGCDRPPSWTEAHHIDEWIADLGPTDVDNGILLCRHHHLLLHNAGWKITRSGADLFVIPPPSVDPRQRPIPAPPRSEALRRLHAYAA